MINHNDKNKRYHSITITTIPCRNEMNESTPQSRVHAEAPAPLSMPMAPMPSQWLQCQANGSNTAWCSFPSCSEVEARRYITRFIDSDRALYSASVVLGVKNLTSFDPFGPCLSYQVAHASCVAACRKHIRPKSGHDSLFGADYGTKKRVMARFWPWLSGESI